MHDCRICIINAYIFSINRTPCVEAFLGSALMLASQRGHFLEGVMMLFAYLIVLGISLILSAVLIDYLKSTFDFIKKHYKIINIISCSLLVFIDALMATGTLGWLLNMLSQQAL